METLFYKFIYEKDIKRSMHMLEFLCEAKHIVTLDDLKEVMNVSDKTVNVTIECARKMLPKGTSIAIKNRNVILDNHSKGSLEDVFIEIAKGTVEFRVLEYAFSDGNLNIHELSNKLFIAETTLRYRIKHMNEVLSTFGCSISSYNVKIQGKETDIRYFYYAYFSEFQELFTSFLSDELRFCSDIFKVMRDGLKKNGIPVLHYSNQQISRWLLLTRERISRGNFVKLDKKFVSKIQRRNYYPEFRTIYIGQVMKGVLELGIPEDEIAWAYVVGFNSIVYTAETPEFELYWDDPDNVEKKKIINSIIEFIMDTFDIQDEQKESYLRIHRAYLLNMSLLTEASSVFQIGAGEIKNYVANTLGNLYITWFDYLSKWEYDNELFLISNIHSICSQLTLMTSQFVYNQRYQEKTILYSFEGEAGFTAYLETIASILMPSGVKGIFLHREAITLSLLKEKKVDLIVSNYRIVEKLECYKCFRMSHVPDIQEWTELRRLIIYPLL